MFGKCGMLNVTKRQEKLKKTAKIKLYFKTELYSPAEEIQSLSKSVNRPFAYIFLYLHNHSHLYL